MAKHCGIVARSAEGAALCYRTICVEGSDPLGHHSHSEIATHTILLSFSLSISKQSARTEAHPLLPVPAEQKLPGFHALHLNSPRGSVGLIGRHFYSLLGMSPIPA